MESQSFFNFRSVSFDSDRRWPWAFAVILMSVTLIPYVLGYMVQGTDWRFTGFVFSVQDGNAYIGKMLFGTMGDWLFRTPYTAFPQRGFLIFLPYVLLGKLVSFPGAHEQLVVLYHLFGFVSGVLVILATYDFLSLFVVDVRYRRLGLVLVALGGGLGWLVLLARRQEWLGSMPLDFYSPESFGFLSLYVYPHYALARALLLWGLIAYLKATERLEKLRSLPVEGTKVGVLWLLTAIAQPLTGMVVGAVIGAYLFVLAAWQAWLAIRHQVSDWPRFWKMVQLAGWAGLVPMPFLVYNLVSSRLDPYLRMWTEQSYFGSPHPLHYLLAYGLVLPFAIVGGRYLWAKKDWIARLPVAWVIFLPILAYAPVGIQRRLPEGIWVAWVVLAMKALEAMQNSRLCRSGVVLLLACPSTVLLFGASVLFALHPAEPLFRPSGEIAAFEHIPVKPGRRPVVLASYETGNALPAWSPAFVIIGHGPESVGLTELMSRVQSFYRADTPASEKVGLLSELNVDYVFWGPHERALGGWNLDTSDFLSPLYQSGDYQIFAVHR